jgi:hypothetical protein
VRGVPLGAPVGCRLRLQNLIQNCGGYLILHIGLLALPLLCLLFPLLCLLFLLLCLLFALLMGECMLDPCTFPVILHQMPRYLNFKRKKNTMLQCFWVNCTQNVIGRLLKILFALLKGFENIFVHVNFVLLRTCLSMSQAVGDQKSTQISV